MNMAKTHALIYWKAEHAFSTVSLSKICEKDENGDFSNLIGKVVKINWNGKQEKGKVLKIGSKREIKKEEDRRVSEANDLSFVGEEAEDEENHQEKKRSKRNRNVKEIFGDSFQDPEVQNPEPEPPEEYAPLSPDIVPDDEDMENAEPPENVENEEQENTENADLPENTENAELPQNNPRSSDPQTERIRQLEEKLASAERKNRHLQRIVKKKVCQPNFDENAKEDIGGGNYVPNSTLDFCKAAFTHRPSFFLRHLVFHSGLFQPDEIFNSSVTGRKSIHSPNGIPRPALNPRKLQAIKAYTLKKCGIENNPMEIMKLQSSITQMIADYRKNETKKRKANKSLPTP